MNNPPVTDREIPGCSFSNSDPSTHSRTPSGTSCLQMATAQAFPFLE
jgi:hypothetical protein